MPLVCISHFSDAPRFPRARIPLTPALSLGEREKHSQFFDAATLGIAKAPGPVPPLPNPDQSGLRSEGWGEGEVIDRV